MGTNESESLTKERIEDLLKGKFGQDVSVGDLTCQPATTAGDNYGSSLFAVDVHILNNNTSKHLHIIAKLLPPTEFLREVFNVEKTFCKEINLYRLVNPAFLKMQQECGFHESEIINLVPQDFGHWTSYDEPESENSAFQAVLLLENLKVCNYQVADRLNGLDLNHCLLVIKNMAILHALTVALREKKPALYEETVLKATGKFHMGPQNVDDVQERREFVEDLKNNVPECRQYVEKILKCVVAHVNVELESLAKEPFATLVHNDLWTNNILFKYEEKSQSREPIDVKFLDFQMTLCCSPARDILFFLYSSAQKEVIENYYDHLIDVYFENFIFLLKKLKCDVHKFSKSALLTEINTFAPTQVFHILFMLGVIYSPKENSEELTSMTSKEHIPGAGGTEFLRKRTVDIVKDFEQKGWLREKSELI